MSGPSFAWDGPGLVSLDATPPSPQPEDMELVDTHCHLTFPPLCDDLDVCSTGTCNGAAGCSQAPSGSCGIDGHVYYYRDGSTGEPKIEAEGAAEVNLGGRPFRIGRGFVEDVRAEVRQRIWEVGHGGGSLG